MYIELFLIGPIAVGLYRAILNIISTFELRFYYVDLDMNKFFKETPKIYIV